MSGTQIDAPELPGLSLRVHDGSTSMAAWMAPILNAGYAAEGVDEIATTAELENWLGHPTSSFDPKSDVVLAEVDGALVGYASVEWVDTTDGQREFRLSGHVHPDWYGRGIGRRLLAWQEEHGRTHAAASPDRTLVFGSWAEERQTRRRRLYLAAGMHPVRHFFEMKRSALGEVEVPPMPEGLEIRPIGKDRASQKQLWDADAEAFQDHWGGFDASEQAFDKMIASPEHDPDLWIVAWEGDEIAGAVTNAIFVEENEAFGRAQGWLETVFVRRPWRKRGLGAAIVARALVRLREAGMSEGLLGVDSDNPSGALGLYERAGFVVDRRAAAYRKPMEGE